MDVTQKAQLDDMDEERLKVARLGLEREQGLYRALVVDVVGRSSYREVARLTGLSTNTLQRWVREAKS